MSTCKECPLAYRIQPLPIDVGASQITVRLVMLREDLNPGFFDRPLSPISQKLEPTAFTINLLASHG